jgi:cyclopropane-fatty-acyl-phospholipid synthase
MSQTHFSSARTLDSEASRKGGDDARATPARIMGLSGLPASGKAVLLALTRLRGGELTMVTPNGERLVFGEGAAKAALHVHDYRLLKRVMKKGDIGFAESYVEGEWSAPDLAATLTLLGAALRVEAAPALDMQLIRLDRISRHAPHRSDDVICPAS